MFKLIVFDRNTRNYGTMCKYLYLIGILETIELCSSYLYLIGILETMELCASYLYLIGILETMEQCASTCI